MFGRGWYRDGVVVVSVCVCVWLWMVQGLVVVSVCVCLVVDGTGACGGGCVCVFGGGWYRGLWW